MVIIIILTIAFIYCCFWMLAPRFFPYFYQPYYDESYEPSFEQVEQNHELYVISHLY